jgi:hypothetical protein
LIGFREMTSPTSAATTKGWSRPIIANDPRESTWKEKVQEYVTTVEETEKIPIFARKGRLTA